MPSIRDALPADAPAITALYNAAIAQSAAVWRDAPVTVEDRRAWMAQRAAGGFPALVAETEAGVVGFAAYGPFHPFEGYRHTVENSVFVAPGLHRRGVGRALMTPLIARAQAAGKHAMVAGIEGANTASIRLHAALGFVEVARLPQVGAKFGRWLDLVYMLRMLDAREAP